MKSFTGPSSSSADGKKIATTHDRTHSYHESGSDMTLNGF